MKKATPNSFTPGISVSLSLATTDKCLVELQHLRLHMATTGSKGNAPEPCDSRAFVVVAGCGLEPQT